MNALAPIKDRSVSYPVVYQDTYGIRGSQMIFEAADEVFREVVADLTHGQCLVAVEQAYFNLMGRDDLTAEMLADEAVNDLGYCFCRVDRKLFVED